jgi:hypothetical protein
MTEIGEILNNDSLVELLEKLNLASYEAIAETSDEELLQIAGIGPATLKRLRAWEQTPPSVKKEDASECIAIRYLVLPGELNIAPGDVIPPEFADEQVAKGKARWR